jgi:hypothetical protein
MGTKSRFQFALSQIDAYLGAQVPPVFSHAQLEALFRAQRREWRLAKAMQAQEFITKLLEAELLRVFEPERTSSHKRLYVRDAATAYELALHLAPGNYFSHESALYLHGLLPTEPARVWVTQEQLPKQRQLPPAPLTQTGVNAAFAHLQRQAQPVGQYRGYSLQWLASQAAGRPGVLTIAVSPTERWPVTGLERTLLDCTVRPAYAGGPATVLAAYRQAAPHLNVAKLADLLQHMAYRYPYNQAVGFYLERAGGYPADVVQPFAQQPRLLDFYLSHATGEATAYCARWRIHYPVTLDRL